MKKRLSVYALLCATLVAAAASCAKIDALSDGNNIDEFHITSHTPVTIELGATEMRGDTIYIPIIYGKYSFPLRFYATMTISQDIDRITGIDLAKEQVLEDIDDVIKFFVVAKSGLARKYFIKAREVPLAEDNYLRRDFELLSSSSDLPISTAGEYSSRGDTLKIYAVGATFPLTIKPVFAIAPESSFTAFENGVTELVFRNDRDFNKIKVRAKSGAEKVWNVKLMNAPVIFAADGVSPAMREGTDIEPRTFLSSLAAGSANTLFETVVDNDTENVGFTLKGASGAPVFPQDIDVSFAVLNGIELYGMKTDTTLAFTALDDTHSFYMLDKEACVSRCWTLGLGQWKNNKADVTSFSYNYTAAQVRYNILSYKKAAIVLDKAVVGIYPDRGEITVKATEVTNGYVFLLINYSGDWKLTIDGMSIGLSPGASIVGGAPSSYVWQNNDSWKTPKEFTVRAEDGTEKVWKLIVKDYRSYTASAANAITEFGIEKMMPSYAGFNAADPATIDAGEKKITINLTEDDGCYPITVYPAYEISQYATIPAGVQPLVFASAEDTKTVSVRAENGAVAEWTVALKAPPASIAADVVSFASTGTSPTAFQVQGCTVDDAASTIWIAFDAIGAYPLTVNYSMSLSSKAKSTIPVRGSMTFTSPTATNTFTVTAQDMVTTREYTVRLAKFVYVPQLPNWNLDSWKDNNTPNSWGTANNTFVKGTTKDTGVTGSVAKMSTSETLGNMASGSLFLGWFDTSNLLDLSDPPAKTFFGIPWNATSKVLGMDVDVWYSPVYKKVNKKVTTDPDIAGATIELIKYTGAGDLVWHGLGHAKNSAQATSVVRKEVAISTYDGTYDSAYGDITITKVPAGQWTTLHIRFDNTGDSILDYTHLNVCFASSTDGDLFIGGDGTVFKVDNVKLVYEED